MIWSGIIICGVITFLIRFIPMSGITSREFSPSTKSSFKYIPLAVLTPIIVNDLSIIENNSLFLIENHKLYAGLISVIVAFTTNNILATISVGMASYLLMSNFMNI